MKKKILGIFTIMIFTIIAGIGISNAETVNGVFRPSIYTRVADIYEQAGRKVPTGIQIKIPFEDYFTKTMDKGLPIFCARKGGRLTSYDNTVVKIGNLNLGQYPDVKEGQRIALKSKPTASQAKNETICTYNASEKKTAGRNGDYDIAYVLYQFFPSADSEGNIDMHGEVQQAFWSVSKKTANKPAKNAIAREAEVYKEYRETIDNDYDGKYEPYYEFNNQNVAFDTAKGVMIVGPIKLNYVRSFTKEEGRDKVDFGGIESITLYDQDGKEIDQKTWTIAYDKEHQDSKLERPAGDEDYGAEGSNGFYSYPYSGEEFNIVINQKGNENLLKISKIAVKFYDVEYTAEYQDLDGTYKDVTKLNVIHVIVMEEHLQLDLMDQEFHIHVHIIL